jgi:hypothetical protein
MGRRCLIVQILKEKDRVRFYDFNKSRWNEGQIIKISSQLLVWVITDDGRMIFCNRSNLLRIKERR